MLAQLWHGIELEQITQISVAWYKDETKLKLWHGRYMEQFKLGYDTVKSWKNSNTPVAW